MKKKQKNGKIVYSYYVLDIVHKGHILQMKNAKAVAGEDGISIVGILTEKAVLEKKSKPITTFDDRMILAQSIKYNDIVVAQDTYSPIPNIKNLEPDVLLESNSHSPDEINETKKVMKELNGAVMVTPYYPTICSTGIKNIIKHRVEK